MKKTSFHFLSVVLLIVGTSLGAGTLGLPVKTGLSGMLPSLISIIAIWGLMLIPAWILSIEIIKSQPRVSDLPTLFQQKLGNVGKWLATVGYLVIFYGVLVSYLEGASLILFNLIHLPLTKSTWTVLFFMVATGIIMFGVESVRKGNAAIMLIVGISFIFLLVKASQSLNPQYLTHMDWHFVPSTIPIIVCTFGFHIIIPTVCRSLGWNFRRCWQALLIGTFSILILNILWVVAVIGALPLVGKGKLNILYAFQENLPATIPLSQILHFPHIEDVGIIFSLGAIITSYFGVGIAFKGFIKDLIISFHKKSNQFIEVILTFCPPLIVALVDPNLFLKALDLVGGFGILLVFGILPVLIVIRHKEKRTIWRKLEGYIILGIFTLLICLELLQELGLLQILPNVEYWNFG